MVNPNLSKNYKKNNGSVVSGGGCRAGRGGAMAVVMGSLLCLLFVIRTALVAGLHAIIPTCLNDMNNLPTVLIATQHNNWLLGKKSTL